MRKDIEQRWLEQVQRDIAKVPDIELTQLRDGIPDYLAALEQLLSRSGASKSDEATGGSIWAEVAREHGITRVQIGFDISQLIHEFLVLRRIIRDVAGENGVALAEADIVLTELIDAAIVEAVQAYVDARDYQTRRTQAENIAFVTHELRNPLTTASQAAVLLRHQATPEQRQALDALERSHRRLGELVDSVLAVQKLDAGKLECHLEEVALGPVIDSTVAAAAAVAERKRLEFRVTYDANARVRLDPKLTTSALQNLADNAVKYTDHGRVEVSADETRSSLILHVRDTCKGLSPAELRTIFEPFQRGATSKEGTGLGLAIARRAVEAQGGSIHAESPGPEGCHFWIELPKR